MPKILIAGKPVTGKNALKIIKELKNTYKIGTKVRLLKMNDRQAPPVGTIGTVTHVDDIGSIHVNWETGSTLALIYGEDEWEIID